MRAPPVVGRQITFTVYGTPVAQSGTRIVPTRAGPRGISTGGKGLTEWRNAVTGIAAAHAQRIGTLRGPIAVHACFRFHMPRSRRKRDRDQGWLHRTGQPDLDKLCRALGDSLTAAGLIADDAHITEWSARKLEVHDNWAGAWVMVSELTEPPIEATLVSAGVLFDETPPLDQGAGLER